uniref:Uncharacterized protein n=1 Tax=Parascaris equorum TaxID=6256 RepID=A0A914RI90_PAREQ
MQICKYFVHKAEPYEMHSFEANNLASKSEYLAHLSERLLRDMENLERDENRRKTTTRIEIERFSGEIQLNKRTYAESEESSESINLLQRELRRAHLSAECEMNRTEDTSCNGVTVAEPRMFSAQLKVISEKTIGPGRRTATYDMQQNGKHFVDETIIRRTNKPDSEALVEESAEAMPPKYIEDQSTLRSMKKYDSEDIEDTNRKRQITECELIRKEDCSWNTVVIAVPRTVQASISQEGQRFEGETVIKRTMHSVPSASADESLEELQHEESIKEPMPGNYEMQLLGQYFRGEGLIKRTRQFLSSESMEEERDGGITQREPDSLRQQKVLAERNKWTETYNGRELNEEQLSVMVAIQKARCDEEMQNDAQKNLFSTVSEWTVAKIRECTEEQAMAVCSLKCAAVPHESTEFVYREKRIQAVLRCTTAAEEEFINTKVLIASSETSAEEAFVQQLTPNSAIDETLTEELSIRRSSQYSMKEQTELRM